MAGIYGFQAWNWWGRTSDIDDIQDQINGPGKSAYFLLDKAFPLIPERYRTRDNLSGMLNMFLVGDPGYNTMDTWAYNFSIKVMKSEGILRSDIYNTAPLNTNLNTINFPNYAGYPKPFTQIGLNSEFRFRDGSQDSFYGTQTTKITKRVGQ